MFFFCKQKTAYEVRISDWSSDVCSSDLLYVSPANLLLAHGAFSGRNPRLARQILAQAQTAEGISQKLLNELDDQESGQPDRVELDRLMTRLETNKIGRASCRERVGQKE